MKCLKASVKMLAFFGVTGSLYLCYCLCLKSAGAQKHLKALWVRWAARIVGMRVSVSGSVPDSGVILVSNHLSYLDILLIWTHMDCVFVAKKEVASWPLLGRIAQSLGTVFIDRTRKRDLMRVVSDIEDRQKRGHSLVFFPEGTSSDGSAVKPFKPGLFDVAFKLNQPVHWTFLRYTAHEGEIDASSSVCWWDEKSFIEHFWKMCQLSGFKAHIVFGETPVEADDRKTLAYKAWECIHNASLRNF